MKRLLFLLLAMLVVQQVSSAQQPPTDRPAQKQNRKILFNPNDYPLDYILTYDDNSTNIGKIYPGSFEVVESSASKATSLVANREGLPWATLPTSGLTNSINPFLGNRALGDTLNTNYFFVIYQSQIIGTNPLPDGKTRDQQFREIAGLTKFEQAGL